MNPYRTLIFAHLVQESALTVGGNRPHEMVDLPLARDGRGRPVLRGTTLAGLFIATARTLVDSLPRAISCGGIQAQPDHADKPLVPSAWRFANAHLLQDTTTLYHQHVSIDERTLAAQDDHLFSLEATSPGTVWGFQIEITPSHETDYATLEALAAEVLARWRQTGGVRLGRGSRHGYGWCHLEHIHVVRLTTQHIELWPNALHHEPDPLGWLEYFRQRGVAVLDFDTWRSCLQNQTSILPARNGAHQVQLSGTIEVGERQDPFGQGYGLDTLSIGGHAALHLQAEAFFERIIPPPAIPWHKEQFDPDFIITARPNAQGKLEPYIPGASIRGVWRAALYRHYRALGQNLTPLEKLFGSTECAGRLSVSDATLLDDDWKLIWQQHVAIDELTGGAYGAAKFDRLAVARGRFGWRAIIEGDSPEEAHKLAQIVIELIQSLGEGHLPLGGGIWHGHGHIGWRLDNHKQETVTV